MYKLLILLLLSSASYAQQSGTWTEGTIFGVRTDNTNAVNALFVNTYTETSPSDGKWTTIDVTALGVPANAKAVTLTGILIITHGMTPELCDLHIAIRAVGDDLHPGNYIGQVEETSVTGGQRSTMSTLVPLREGKFEYYWTRSTQGNWPNHCSYGINLSLQGYIR